MKRRKLRRAFANTCFAVGISCLFFHYLPEMTLQLGVVLIAVGCMVYET